MVFSASGNVLEGNTVAGNTNGILIAQGTRNTLVRNNLVIGNPNIQVANTRPDAQAVDILNLAPPGETTFERNVCITSVNAPCPTLTPPLPPQLTPSPPPPPQE